MFAEERLAQIVELVNRQGKVTVAQLSGALGVSPATVRRDLERLEKRQLLLRTHGGALPLTKANAIDAGTERPFAEKAESHAAEKERIAATAARMVADGETVMLSPGSTNMRIARKLAGKKDLTLVTNAANIAVQVADEESWDVVLLGGQLRGKSYALVGSLTEQALAGIRIDKLFLGVDGIDREAGLTTPNMAEAEVNRRMIEIAREVIVVADHSKFGKVTFSRIAPLTAAHVLITDRPLPQRDADWLREQEVRLIVAD